MEKYVLNCTGDVIDILLSKAGESASENFVKTEIAKLVNSAPETLDTLGEIADAIEDNEDVVETLNSAITNKADKSYVDEAIAALAGSSTGGGIGIEIGTVERDSSSASVYTLQHPSLFVIANNGRQNYYDELSSITELNFTVLLTPGKTEDVRASSNNKRQESLSLSSDGTTLTLTEKGYSCYFISFYQL